MTFTEKQLRKQTRRSAIKLQNASSRKLSMAEALAALKAQQDAEKTRNYN